MQRNINELTVPFSGISLSEMDDVALLKRTDTKYILSEELLSCILYELSSEYRILEIQKNRLFNYRSLYFDTSGREFYYEHHNGKIKRTKIRMRQYVESDLYFLEVKMKDGRSNTVKSRMPIASFEDVREPLLQEFIQDTTSSTYLLEPVLWNNFQRITLVNNKYQERVTIDLNLSFSFEDKVQAIDNLAIIELKQERHNSASPLIKVLRKHGVKAFGISKYCIGMTNLWSNLKHNAFKPKLLKVKKISA